MRRPHTGPVGQILRRDQPASILTPSLAAHREVRPEPKNRQGKFFVNFSAAVSDQAVKEIRAQIRNCSRCAPDNLPHIPASYLVSQKASGRLAVVPKNQTARISGLPRINPLESVRKKREALSLAFFASVPMASADERNRREWFHTIRPARAPRLIGLVLAVRARAAAEGPGNHPQAITSGNHPR